MKSMVQSQPNKLESQSDKSETLRQEYKKHEVKGIIHGNQGRESNRKLSKETVKKMEGIIRKKYPDFGPTFAVEKLDENHRIKVGKETLRKLMIKWDVWIPRPRKNNKEY